jgi:hypothetical protein
MSLTILINRPSRGSLSIWISSTIKKKATTIATIITTTTTTPNCKEEWRAVELISTAIYSLMII